MLMQIGDVSKVPEFVQKVKEKKALQYGFGHRVYKNYDPRARIVKGLSEETFKILGRDPLIEIALELEKISLSDEYFKKKNL